MVLKKNGFIISYFNLKLEIVSPVCGRSRQGDAVMNITRVHLDKGRAEAGATLRAAAGNSRDAFANQPIQFISRFHHVYSELWLLC